MKSVLTLAIMLTAAGSAAFGGSACTTDTLANYIADFGITGCTIGTDFKFDNFGYVEVNAFATPVTAADILVTPTDGVSGPSLDFSADWKAAGLISASESLILFSIDSITPGIEVSAVTLADQGSVTAGPLGLALGTAAVAEVDCFGGFLNFATPSVACLGGGIGAAANATLPLSTDVSANALLAFASSVPEVDVIKDITLTGILDSASITGIQQDFTSAGVATGAQVPEPVTLALVGFGLIAGAFARRIKVGGASMTR